MAMMSVGTRTSGNVGTFQEVVRVGILVANSCKTCVRSSKMWFVLSCAVLTDGQD